MTTANDLFRPGDATDFFQLPGRRPFPAGVTAYSDVIAWWLMELSRLIYRNEDRERFLDNVDLSEQPLITRDGTQCFVVRARDRRWGALVFRGSDDINAWLTNIDCPRRPWPQGGAVHEGFADALERVWDDVEHQLDRIDCPVYYSGHSLGAALATLAASRRPPVATYAFGSPLVGDDAFARSFDGKPLYRIVNCSDCVTLVPAAIGFHHAGIRQPIGPPRVLDVLDALNDHAPINYTRHISERIR